MNDDLSFARVKVRKQLLPLMQSFNNRIVEAISRTATQLREDGAYLSAILMHCYSGRRCLTRRG
jgi:hypothetical protein